MGMKRVHIHVERIAVSRAGDVRPEVLAAGIRREIERSFAAPTAIESLIRAGDVSRREIRAQAGRDGNSDERVGKSVASAILGSSRR